MASGRLGAVDLAASTNTELYTVPVLTTTAFNLSICNRSASSVNIRVAITSGAVGTLTNADYIEYDLVLASKDVYERTGIVASAGNTIVVYSSAIDVNAICWGFEEST